VDKEPNAQQEKNRQADTVHMKTTRIELHPGVAGFAEDKDLAKSIRLTQLLPALARGNRVVLDFHRVKYATQSFVHALLGEPLSRYGEALLDQVEFKNCSQQLQSVVELVVDYSLGGFPNESEVTQKHAVSPKEKRPKLN
jgi:hypothetical protein